MAEELENKNSTPSCYVSDQVIKWPPPCFCDDLDGEYDCVDVKVSTQRFAGSDRDSSLIKITRGICLM